ncbi:MAG: CoA-binding protein [Bacteroidia bacterium]|nr:CoA-binding protein [Bacteroidia bacterium]
MLKKILVIGASENPARYSFMAVNRLLMSGYEVIAVGVKKGKIREVNIITEMNAVEAVHTVTLYINPIHQEAYYDAILKLKPQRVIFNPGAENPDFEEQLQKAGIETVQACTLVMLSTGQF